MKLEITTPYSDTSATTHDRLSVIRDEHRTLIALADGVDSGAASQVAAALTVRELARCFRNDVLPDDPWDWEMILDGIDLTVFKDPVAGETSALVMLVQRGVVLGASVGDSLAYTVSPQGRLRVITPSFPNTTRVGSAMASPIGFGPFPLEGKLITRRGSRDDASLSGSAHAAA
ncbi:MAG: protein phosphatase 2C domain-containing protein [Polyangiales bacterium]